MFQKQQVVEHNDVRENIMNVREKSGLHCITV